MRVFSFSEAYGPFRCEEKGCDNEAWDCVLSEIDNKTLPENTGSVAAKFILSTGLGKMLCEDHMEDEK